MPDARVQAAIDNWAPRMVTQGIDYNDFVRTTAGSSAGTSGLTPGARRPSSISGWRARRRPRAGPRPPARPTCGRRSASTSPSTSGSSTATQPRGHRARPGRALRRPSPPRPDRRADRGAARRRDGGCEPAPAAGAGAPAARDPDPGPRLDEGGVLQLRARLPRSGMATLSLDGPGQGETGFERRSAPTTRWPSPRSSTRSRGAPTWTSAGSAPPASASAATTRRAPPPSSLA